MRVCFVCFVHFLCDLQPYFSCNLHSYNPTSHKATTLTRRVQLVCDSPNSLHDETDYLNNVSSKNNYKADFVRRNTHSNTDSNTQRLHRTSEATLKLSHVYYNFTFHNHDAEVYAISVASSCLYHWCVRGTGWALAVETYQSSTLEERWF